MIKITVISPSVRVDMLALVAKSLRKQTFLKEETEWIVVMPPKYKKECEEKIQNIYPFVFVEEPPKKEGDFYGLCKAYNEAFKQAKGELLISWQDGIWADANTLQHFWDLYEANPKSCVGGLGDQFSELDDFGKPTMLHWQDPRRTNQYGEYYEIYPVDIEFTLCGLPKKGIFEAGGFEEEFDKGAAVGEKELAIRMDRLGYKFYLDQGLSYRALHHPRLTTDWDKYYGIACDLYDQYKEQIIRGQRTVVPYLNTMADEASSA